MNSGIYKITNKANCNFYYGSTGNFKKRWRSHRWFLQANKHCNAHLQSAWNKYGFDNFKFSIVIECPKEECLTREQEYLDLYWDNGTKCYNISKDVIAPMLGRHASTETKQKMSIASMNKKWSFEAVENIKGDGNHFYGRTHTRATKNKQSESHIGLYHTQKAKDRISLMLKGKKKPVRSAEHSKKISDALKNKTWKLVDGKRVWSDKQ